MDDDANKCKDEITSAKRKRNMYHSINDRPALLQALTTWRKEAHAQDPYRAV